MMSRKWTNREINKTLQRLGACYELPPERSAALEARVRRETIARYGRFDISLTPATSAQESTAPRSGMLMLLRPAFALAGVAAVAVGAVLALQRSGWGPFRAQGIRQPVVAPPAEVVAVAAPIVPGSGVAVSVFGVPENQESGIRNQESSATGARPSVIRRVRRTGRPINPASSVFDQWGESVFSDEGVLQNERDGKNIFNS